MSFFGTSPLEPVGLRRLDEAAASNLAAQAGLQQAGIEVAETSRQTRREAVLERRRVRLASRALRERPLQTGYALDLVEEMLGEMGQSADSRAKSRH